MVLIGIGSAGHNLINSFSNQHTKISITVDDFPKHCKKTEDFEEHYASATPSANHLISLGFSTGTVTLKFSQ